MGFLRDVFGGGRRPDPLPPVATPAGDALRAPLESGLRGEGFDPAGEAASRRERTTALRTSFVGGQRDFNRTLDRTLQRGDVGARKVAGDLRDRRLNLELERVRDSGAAVNFEQRLQAQDIGAGVASNELSTDFALTRARSSSKIRRTFAPDFTEGFTEGISGGLGVLAGSGAFGGIGQPGAEAGGATLGPGQQGPPISFASPGVQSRFNGTAPSPSTDFFSRFSQAFRNSP